MDLNTTVTVFTPIWADGILATHPEWFTDAARSIIEQPRPGMSVDWVIHFDGPIHPGLAQRAFDATAGSDIQVRIHGGEWVGAMANVRRAAEHATGEWVCLLDADDVLCPSSIVDRLAVAVRTGRGAVAAGAIRWDITGPAPVLERYDEHFDTGPISADGYRQAAIDAGGGAPLVPNTLLMRRDRLVEVGYWPSLDRGHDEGLAHEFGLAGDLAFAAIDSMLYRYHERGECGSSTHMAAMHAAQESRLAELLAERAS